MRDDDTGNAAHADRLHHLVLRLGVQRRRRFVQNADGRILRQRPGDLDPLPLSAGEVAPVLGESVLIAARTQDDILVDLGVPGCHDHLKILDGGIPHLDIVRDRVLKQRHVLVDDRHRPDENISVDLLDGTSVEGDASAPGLIQPAQELGKRRLAAAGAAHKGYLLTRLYREREVRDQRSAQRRVAEHDVLHLDPAHQLFVLAGLGALLQIGICRVAHDVVHALHLRNHLLEGLPGLDHGVGRRHKGAHKALEGHDHTGCEGPVQDQIYARAQHRDVGKGGHQGRDRIEKGIGLDISVLLRVDARLKARPASEHASFRAAGLDRLDHSDVGGRRRRQFGAVPQLHPRQIHLFGRDNDRYGQIDGDRRKAYGRQGQAVADHRHQVKDQHGHVQHQRRKCLHELGRDLGIDRLTVREIRGEPLTVKLHRQPQYFPHIGRAALGCHLALNSHAVYGGDPQDHDIDDGKARHPHDKGHEPLRVLPAQEPVQEDPAKDRADDAHQRRDRRCEHHKYDRRRGAGQPLFRVAKDGLALPRGLEVRPRLHRDHDARELPVKFLHGHFDPAPGGVVEHRLIVPEAAQHHKVIEPPVNDAREGSLRDQILRIHAPGLGGHTVAAGRQNDIPGVRAVPGHAAVHPGLLQRDELFIIVHDHRQRRRSALQHLQLHDHGHLHNALCLWLWYPLTACHVANLDNSLV